MKLSLKQRIKNFFSRPHKRVKFGNRYVGPDEPVFIIAEIGINHNGSIERAKQLIDVAVDAGADCAKFQMRDIESLYSNKGDANDITENLNSQYILDVINKFQLTPEQMFEVFDYGKNKGIFVLCTPFDLKSLERLEKYGMHTYKVGSADMTNHELLEAIVKTGKPMICSTGMAEEHEIAQTNRLLRRLGAKYVLLHCNSAYPAPFEDINLRYMERLGTALYGYSGHERGINIAIAAVARGAKVVEKHLTFDREMEGPDHKASLLPEEFKTMVQGIREVEKALGTGPVKRTMSQGERLNRTGLAKSVIAKKEIKKGEKITRDMLDIKSPGKGLQPNRINELIGKKARRTMKIDSFFYPGDLLANPIQPRNYTFKLNWGIPVRYHDYKSLMQKTNLGLLEFHLSYKDVDLDPDQFFDKPYENLELVVHSPETFAGDHLLDLSHPDPAHRAKSLKEIERVIKVARKLKKFFPRTPRPRIVVNLGGFTKHEHVSEEEKKEMYVRMKQELKKLDLEGVELTPQTMPPYPWLLGGQWHQHILMEPNELKQFCEETGLRICLDVSHSQLAANKLKTSFKDFVETVGPHVAHLHIVDAAGVGDEGVQIGEGDVDFVVLKEQVHRLAPEASFIPEIWQGHENEGEGFWNALNILEKHGF